MEELYGDSRDDEWKREEIALHLKAEQGITGRKKNRESIWLPVFLTINLGGDAGAGQSNEPDCTE